MPIRFFYEEAPKIKFPRKSSFWINEAARREKRSVGEISYIFCSDEFLLQLNQQFLQHNTFTDILSFDSSDGKVISGEIYISVDRVNDNAAKFGTKPEDELRRVMVHGVLHFCGYKDKTSTQKTVMRKKEEAYLSLWKRMFHVEP